MTHRIFCPTHKVMARWRSGSEVWGTWRWFRNLLAAVDARWHDCMLPWRWAGKVIGLFGLGAGEVVRWPAKVQQPRTCSACGGIHPDDCLALVRDGWELLEVSVGEFAVVPPGVKRDGRMWCNGVMTRSAVPVKERCDIPIPAPRFASAHFDDEDFNKLAGLYADFGSLFR